MGTSLDIKLLNALERTIIALDFQDKIAVEKFLTKVSNCNLKPSYVKVGMELFYSEGPEIVRVIKDLGFKVFLDLKVFDIPNTALGALKSIAKLGVDMTNVHALGATDMMKKASETIKEYSPESLLIAVTILTSVDQATLKNDLMINAELEDVVLALAKKSKDSGLDGVVCSALEAESIKNNCGESFVTVCPGIRFAENSSDDQKRIMTPEKAIKSGVDYLVMGRAITKATDLDSVFKRLAV